MEYKILGKSGLKVSVIGFGDIPIQRGKVEDARLAILAAEEKGVNFIDSARGYTVSEEFIGKALEGRREKWLLATKSMSRDKISMEKDIEISLNNFKTDHIDLYQLHNIKDETELERVMKPDGAYSALLEAKSKGKILHIGITSHSLTLLEKAIETGYFETIMYPYNIVENQAEKLFKRAKELNIGVIAMKPLAGGAIKQGDIALKYIFNNDAVTIAIPGMATKEEVNANAKVAEEGTSLSPVELKIVEEIKAELGDSFCRRCGYCAPCSQGIDIPSMFLLSGYKERYNLPQWAETRYFSNNKRAKDCIACGACEPRCPYGLPIINMLKAVRKTFNE